MVHVDVTPEEAWAALAAFDRISEWAVGVDHSSYLTEQTEGVGATRRVQAGRTVLVERITEWDPPRALAYAIEGLPPVAGVATNRWVLRPDGNGTTVSLTASVEGGVKPVARLVARRLAKVNEGLLAGLREELS
jgi:hypothetical protein